MLREAVGRALAGSDAWCVGHNWLGQASLDSADPAGALGHFTAVRDAVAGEINAVGLGIPCLIDDEHRLAASSVHLPISGLALSELMAERLVLPAFVDNDANLALLAEHRSGKANHARPLWAVIMLQYWMERWAA